MKEFIPYPIAGFIFGLFALIAEAHTGINVWWFIGAGILSIITMELAEYFSKDIV